LEELARIQIETARSAVVARISGEVDISNVDLIKRKLTDSVTRSSPGLVVDVSDTTYLDSSGVYLLFELARALDGRGQRLSVVAPPTAPSTRVLLITGLDRMVSLTSTLEEAVATVETGAPAPSA
jgi:anti-sigma B factor antagonist